MDDRNEPTAHETHTAITAVWRVESARLHGALVRLVRDVELAEDLAQDALVAALQRWPEQGIPDRPGAWLLATAKNRAIDRLRHRRMAEAKLESIAIDPSSDSFEDELHERLDGDVGDDVLRLILVACHPVLGAEARVALTLRLVAGLTTEEIARAFLVPEPTIAQRIVRAKKTLGAAQVPFEVPRGDALTERLSSVLEVIYLIFNEGYSATAGAEWMRTELCDEAMRLGRVLAQRVEDSEAQGLVALMELQASRFRARRGPRGEPVLLMDQDRSRWDAMLVGRGLAALERAERLAASSSKALGPYVLQAAIAACHARARRAETTDWVRIVVLYDALVEITGSPVVELNRAVAVSMAVGPELGPAAALALVDELASDPLVGPSLRGYHLLPSVRADFLRRLGRHDEAAAAYRAAARLTQNETERAMLLARADEMQG
jgi:RNA polymerase sigma factor (sigma-70 family)